MNELFNLFGFNFDDFNRKLTEFTDALQEKYNDFQEKYNDTMKNIKRYDLDTEEGYEAFIKDSAELRKELETNNGPFSRYIISLLDKSVEHVMKNHQEQLENKKRQQTVSELVNAEVNRAKKESHQVSNKCDCHNEGEIKKEELSFKWPSDNLSERHKRNIWKYVDKYMDEMVIPYLPKEKKEDDALIEDMSGGLFEFAAWLLNVKEED